MRHHDRQHRTGHLLQEDRGRLQHLDHGEPGFKLLGAITQKRRPMIRARNNLFQAAHHLTAIAHAQGKPASIGEEIGKRAAKLVMKENRFGPSLACAQDIAIGEPTACR